MNNALTEAVRLGLDTVQVFTKNQQQWVAKPLEKEAIAQWRDEVAKLGWQDRTVSHASYLINLASCNDELWEKSVNLMREEIERCEVLGIPFLVHHPGSSVGWTREKGIARIALAYKRLFSETKGYKTVSCLEGTVGAGSTLGGPYEDLAELRSQIVELSGESKRIGFCLDSCHLHAAGHDMSTREAAEAALERFDSMCGISNLKVLHLNDSKGKLASKLDRHEHIGEGWVGGGATMHTGKGTFSSDILASSGFAAIVNHPALAAVPKIMETPKEKNAQGVDMDVVNVARLRGLIGIRAAPRASTASAVSGPATLFHDVVPAKTPANSKAPAGVEKSARKSAAVPRSKSQAPAPTPAKPEAKPVTKATGKSATKPAKAGTAPRKKG